MSDATELVRTIKQTALDAVEAAKPVNVCYGVVLSADPLQIQVDQKMTLGEMQLVLTRNVTDYSVKVTVDWDTDSALTTHTHTITDGTSGATNLAHTHGVTGTKTMTVLNALTAGESVILIRQQEGQKYIVLDRIG